MKKIVGIVGTNSDQSTNRQLLEFMANHYANVAEIELIEIKDLPMFNKPNTQSILPIVKEMADKIEAADGVIISTPEHDHSPPAALSNALAWLSYGIYPFLNKPVMIVGASYGTLGSSRAQIQLHQLLDAPELRAHVMPSAEFLLSHSLQAFDEDGNLVFKEKVRELDLTFTNFLRFIEIIRAFPDGNTENIETVANYVKHINDRKSGAKVEEADE